MILNINSALVGIGYGLLVLFFAIGIFSSAASFRELQRPEFALRHFIRFVLAKVAVGRGSICGSVVSASMNSIGGGVTTTAALPAEIVSAIEDVGFLQSIPLWLVSFLGSLLITVLSFILILTVYGRFFKLYIYTAISPLPFASFAGERGCRDRVGLLDLLGFSFQLRAGGGQQPARCDNGLGIHRRACFQYAGVDRACKRRGSDRAGNVQLMRIAVRSCDPTALS